MLRTKTEVLTEAAACAKMVWLEKGLLWIMKELTYQEIIDQIEHKRRFGNLSGVDISGRMLRQLGGPEKHMNFIHLAGTNGKGSVSAFLCGILREAGLKTGMFTSPHLVDFRERIRVDGEMIPEDAVMRIGGALLKQDFSVFPTMFDYCFCMAVLYFKEQGCDVVILETGLGGRLDSTNAIPVPKVTVITKIGYDHMSVLGGTLKEIAAEKAGIMKKGTKLVLGSQDAEAFEVLTDAAARAGITQYETVRPEELRILQMEGGNQRFSFRAYEDLRMQMLGIHQYENAAAAILAAEAFLGCFEWAAIQGLDSCIRRGIYKTVWKGRMEILRDDPFLMVDGAHNSSGVRALKDSLIRLYPGERFHFIMGVMADKDYETMIEELLPLAEDFTAVTAGGERALNGEDLAFYIRGKGIPAKACEDLRYLMAKDTDRDGKTVAFGSLYFVGEIESLF